jgi:hypothetical protein
MTNECITISVVVNTKNKLKNILWLQAFSSILNLNLLFSFSLTYEMVLSHKLA